MATRFYFPGTGSGFPDAIDKENFPAKAADWDELVFPLPGRTANSINRNFGTAQFKWTNQKNVTDNPGYVEAFQQYICEPIPSFLFTTAMTVKGQFICQDLGTGDPQMTGAVIIDIVSNNAETVRGRLLTWLPTSVGTPSATQGTDFSKSETNRIYPPSLTLLNQVQALNGDRIVFALGTSYFTAGTGSGVQSALRATDLSTTDLPENETDTDVTKNPWIEFSANIYDDGTGAIRTCRTRGTT